VFVFVVKASCWMILNAIRVEGVCGVCVDVRVDICACVCILNLYIYIYTYIHRYVYIYIRAHSVRAYV